MKFIRKWLTEFRSLAEPASVKYFEAMKFNDELVEELHNMFNNLDSESTSQLLDPVCHQLFNCYKSNVSSLHNFALEFIPAIVWSYFNSLKKGSKQQSGGIAAYLLGVYNLGTNEISKCCVPSVFQSSLYHDPPFFSSTPLTESALRNRHNGHPNSLEVMPKKFDSITSQNRSFILGFAIKVYLSNVSLMSFRSRKNLCMLCSRLSRMGLDNVDIMSPVTTSPKKFSTIHENSVEMQRGSFEPQLVVELLYGMQFLMYNGLTRHAIQAVEDAHFRASYDLQPEILMVTSALLNFSRCDDAIKDNHSILSVTPAHSFKNHPSLSKDAITNASFRPKKLPEDIEVQDKNEQVQSDGAIQSSGEDQTIENEKSPQSKLNKLQQVTKYSQKKEKLPKMQKSKESESSKRLSTGLGFSSDIDGIQLKAIRRNSQDFVNLNDLGFKSKSSKLLQADHKNMSLANECSNEADDTSTNLLSRSTFL